MHIRREAFDSLLYGDRNREVNAMPYISIEDRSRLDEGGKPDGAGELNYAISRLIDEYLSHKGEIRYAHLNEVVGVLECAKLELYRRLAAPYEDRKRDQHGEVYRSQTSTSG